MGIVDWRCGTNRLKSACEAKVGVNKPVRARKCTSDASKFSQGPSVRSKIEPQRTCSGEKMQHERAQHCDFLLSECERARQSNKVRVGGVGIKERRARQNS